MLGPLDEPLRIPKFDLALWFFLTAACGGAVYGSLEASKGLTKSYTANRKQIDTAEKSLEKAAKPAKGGARPNAAAKKQVDTQNTALKKQLVELWQTLYQRQQKFLVWPKLAEQSTDPNQLKPGDELPAAFSKAYNSSTARSEFEQLFNKLQVRRAKTAVQSTSIENLPFSDRPDDFDGLVAWNPKTREALVARYHLEDAPPSSTRVRIWQEDLWLFESLVNAVCLLNQNATDPLSAPLKQIDLLEVAQWASAAACQGSPTIWLPEGTEPPKSAAVEVPTAKSSDESLVKGRYLDENGKPLAAGSKQPFSEFKQVFVYLKVVMDQRRVNDLMAALSNADLPVETRHLVIHVPDDTTVRPAATDSEAPAATAEADTLSSLATAETTPWDAVVEIGGIVYLYNPPEIKQLGKGAAGKPDERSFRTPVAANVP